MKKILLIALLASLTLTACDKQEAPKDTPAQSEQTTAKTDGHDKHDDHDHDDKDDKHDKDSDDKHDDHKHDGHDHAGHDHSHGTPYDCDNGKHIHVDLRDHEGEQEAQVTYDDIEYDLPLDPESQQYISPTDGFIDGQGMAMTLDGNKATFTTLSGNTITSCTKGS